MLYPLLLSLLLSWRQLWTGEALQDRLALTLWFPSALTLCIAQSLCVANCVCTNAVITKYQTGSFVKYLCKNIPQPQRDGVNICEPSDALLQTS